MKFIPYFQKWEPYITKDAIHNSMGIPNHEMDTMPYEYHQWRKDLHKSEQKDAAPSGRLMNVDYKERHKDTLSYDMIKRVKDIKNEGALMDML